MEMRISCFNPLHSYIINYHVVEAPSQKGSYCGTALGSGKLEDRLNVNVSRSLTGSKC